MSQVHPSIHLWTQEWALSRNLKATYLKHTTSTMDQARADFPNFTGQQKVYLADHQSHGRGRDQRVWQDLKGGEVLLSTWCFRLNSNPQPILTPLIGLALYKSLTALAPNLNFRLKAPNDILLNEAKLSGLLVEATLMGTNTDLYVGLGLNVWQAPKVDQASTSLNDHIKLSEANWHSFCEHWLTHLEQAIALGIKSELAIQERQELLKALNGDSGENAPFEGVSPKGDLYTAAGTLSWMDL